MYGAAIRGLPVSDARSGADLACPEGRELVVDVILKDEEAERQRGLLLRLQVALGNLSIRAVLARNHHLGLPTEHARVSGACGLKPPSLHVFTGTLGLLRVQVSGQSYALATGQSFAAGNAETTAQEISRLTSSAARPEYCLTTPGEPVPDDA
jgi:hypothetical protein